MKLSELQSVGALLNSLEEVEASQTELIPVSEFDRLPKEKQDSEDRVIVLDACEWIATAKAKNVKDAQTVYSGKGLVVSCWKKHKHFFVMVFDGEKLNTRRQIKLNFKEEKNMPTFNAGTADMHFGELDSEVAGVTPSATVAPEAKNTKKEEKARDLAAIREKVSSVAIVDASKFQLRNKREGRLVCFITKDNSTVKLGKKRTPVLGPDGERQLKPDVPNREELVAKYPKKNYPLSACVTENSLVLGSKKPGAIVGVIIKTPAASEVSLLEVTDRGKLQIKNTEDKTMRHRVLSKEQSYVYIASSYGDWIKEDEAILGARASRIGLKSSISKHVDQRTNQEIQEIRTSFCVINEGKGSRKAVLVEGNYFPLSIYETASLANPTKEEIEALNLNVAACCKDDTVYDSFTAETKQIINRKVADDGTVTFDADWFNGTKPVDIPKYDGNGAGDVLTDVRVPIREMNISKSGKATYKFKKIGLTEPNGPLAVYANLVKASGLTEEAFTKKVAALGSARRAKSRAEDVLTSEDLLKAVTSNTIKVQGITSSLKELANSIELDD